MIIGGMVWRLGDEVGFFEQIRWFRDHGMEGVAFHTAPAFRGAWASFDVRTATTEDRAKLRKAVAGFAEVSIHAEFDNYDVSLCSPNELVRRASVETLRGSLELAAELGAPVVTVHEGQTHSDAPLEVRRQALARSVDELGLLAVEIGTSVGFELTANYDLVLEAEGPVGITLDVGHVSMDDGAGYRGFGTIGGLIRVLGPKLIHVHVHDFDGARDHIALGAGHIDFLELVTALREIEYQGMLCLELAPGVTEPDDYVRGMSLLRDLGA
ncbi:MAG: sugar phosphate isomerase/epimerase [Armatimonadetes bacterium]|nr:sugar phosphate isomerase/epimerase [Armatimonadota bacterium]